MADPLRFRTDEPADHPGITVDAFLDQPDTAAVRVEPGDDPRALLPHLARLRLIEINFPAFTDGRGYSSARILREAGYDGELRAVGEVLVDQLAFLRRCGFDAFQPEQPFDPADAEAALARWREVYQPAADGRSAIWAKRTAARH